MFGRMGSKFSYYLTTQNTEKLVDKKNCSPRLEIAFGRKFDINFYTLSGHYAYMQLKFSEDDISPKFKSCMQLEQLMCAHCIQWYIKSR